MRMRSEVFFAKKHKIELPCINNISAFYHIRQERQHHFVGEDCLEPFVKMKFNRLFYLALLGAVIPVQSTLSNKVTNHTDIDSKGEMNITADEPIGKYIKPQPIIGIASVALASLKAIGASVTLFCTNNPEICAELGWRIIDALTPSTDAPAPQNSGAGSVVGCPVWTFVIGVCLLLALHGLCKKILP
ncbi:unnamed protein product [Lymnaea stagnalis]|uniref:Uncharacterized protein n=1 Tax=Lymnaea stagnalis TaxID=6523 RepID=A0AAV2IM07_LYMST